MIGWVFLAACILATVAAQLAFKTYFINRHRLFLITAALLFCAAVPCTYFAVRDLGIGRVYVGTALTYVITPLAAKRVLGEPLQRGQYLALGLILAGVLLYNL